MWAHSLTGAADLVTYRTMPTQELRGGNPDAYDSQKAKEIARQIYDAYKQQDVNNGTNYSSSLSPLIYESDEDKWVKARRQLIERAATFEQAPPPCASRTFGGGGERRVQFAEGRDVRDFFEDAPVALSGGSSSSSLMPLVRGVMLEAVAPVIFAAGASNCKSNPGFAWTPGGSNGPDGMGYCPHDYEPGTVLPGFDGGLYKVAVGRDGSRVWTSAGDAPVAYRIVQRPQGADGMGLLDGAGLGDYDTYSWPAHVPQSWASYGYRRNCNAYSFLPSHMHHSILRYLVDGRIDRSKATSTGGVGEVEAKALLDKFDKPDAALALVSTGSSVTFNKDYAYLGKLSAEDPPSGTSGSASGSTSGSTSGSASGSTSTPLSKVYVPNGTGILATDKVLFVGTFTKEAKWGEFKGGAESFKGWKLQVETDGSKVVATYGTGEDGSFKAANPDRKLEVGKGTELKKDVHKAEGFLVDDTAQSAYCAGDASGYAFELRRHPVGTGSTDHAIWLRIGKSTTGKGAVQEGWMCKVAGTAADGLAMKFKIDGKGQTQVTHLYAGHVDAFGMPTKLGVLQQLGADLATTEQRGEFRLGQLVLGSCGVKQHGFFLDGKLYGDAKFRAAAFTKALEKSVDAKKHVDGKKDELKKQLGEFSAVVNPVQLDLKGGASKVLVRGTPVRDAPVPQDDLPIFGVAPATYLDVKGGMHGALHNLPSVSSSAHMPAHTLAMHPPAPPAMPSMSTIVGQTKPAVLSASSILGPELRKGQVDVDISTRVQKAQEQLRNVNSKGADARLVDELKGYADLLFRKGEQFVNLEDGLPARASGLSSAEEEKRKAELARVLQEVIKPCQTLVEHRDSKHAWTRQYVHMLSLKILALVKYICSSERTGVSELCKLRESVEQCLAFALK
jgi:hypothetical protein